MAKHCSYSVTTKLKAVEIAEKVSKESAARQFKVDPKRIREWCKQKEALVQLTKQRGPTSTRKRLGGAGRKVKDEDMEETLLNWVLEMRDQNLRVSRRMLQVQAKVFASKGSFKASKGWLDKFLKRNGLSLRRKTTVCQSPPSDCIPKLVSFITHLRSIQRHREFPQSCIFAMDETACWMDMPSDTTIHKTGARSVSLKTSGHEKDHYTVILTARADGFKSKPYVVFKGKGTRLMKTLQKIDGVIVRFSTNGWMNDTLTSDYLRTVIGQLSFRRRLLICDAYRCHTSEATRAETTRLRIDTCIVPGGCTKFIQAADVVWNASFKSHMRQLYDEWLSDPSQHEFTKGGNMKAPSRALLCEWVKQSWAAVSTDMVRESFVSCAITTSIEGTDDDKIHCFKPGQPCAAGKTLLKEETEKARETPIDDDDDPFASDEDEAEDENNEAIIENDSDVESTCDSSDEQ